MNAGSVPNSPPPGGIPTRGNLRVGQNPSGTRVAHWAAGSVGSRAADPSAGDSDVVSIHRQPATSAAAVAREIFAQGQTLGFEAFCERVVEIHNQSTDPEIRLGAISALAERSILEQGREGDHNISVIIRMDKTLQLLKGETPEVASSNSVSTYSLVWDNTYSTRL